MNNFYCFLNLYPSKKLKYFKFIFIFAGMKKTNLLYIILFGLLFSACETDFDLTAEYKDITVVYGLLNQDSVTYLKINKAFLGEGDALIMAKIEDSSNYAEMLDVKIEEWADGNLLNTFQLDTVTIDNKKPGLFYNPYQILYKTEAALNEDYTYKLKILNGEKEITSETELVHDFTIKKPPAGSPYINFTYNPVPSKVEWLSAVNGRRYEVIIRFYFKEKSVNNPDTITRYIDWGLGTKKSQSLQGGESMIVTYFGENFYKICKNNIPYEDPAKEADVISRYPGNVDFIISVAGEDLNTYIEVNEPSNSIVQQKPEYSNITNGIGVFSGRYKKIRTKLLKSDSFVLLEELNIKFYQLK